MEIKVYDGITTFKELKEKCWGGALQVLERVEEKGLENELMDLLACLNESAAWNSLTAINNFIWLDLEMMKDMLNGFEKLWSDEEEEDQKNGTIKK